MTDHVHEWVRQDNVNLPTSPPKQLWKCACGEVEYRAYAAAIDEVGKILKGQLPIDSITVRQDVGGHYPVYKRVTLDLMPDGTVRWRDVEYD